MSAPAPVGGALVTGAGRGLGARIAEVLAERGHLVQVTDVDLAAAEETAARIGRGAFATALDVRDPEACAAAARLSAEKAGRLSVWVNNAGVLATGPAWTNTAEQRQLMLEVNIGGVMNGTLAAIEQLRMQRTATNSGTTFGGHIVNIASLAGLVAVPGESVYAATKHAVLGFSLSTQADLRLSGEGAAVKKGGIRISCICPDGIWTPMLTDKLEDPQAALSFSGRLLSVDDVAGVLAKVLDKPRQVTAIPGWRGAQVRMVDALPELGARTLPLGVLLGRRTQKKFLRNGIPDRLR